MWVSKKRWEDLEQRVSALEQREQERKEQEKLRKSHAGKSVDEAKRILGFGK